MAPIHLLKHIDIEAFYTEALGKVRRRGDQLDALCLLHDDKKPSFTANVKTGLWHCRAGCGSGDLIEFHARRHGIDRKQAFKELMERYVGGKRGRQPRKGKVVNDRKRVDPSNDGNGVPGAGGNGKVGQDAAAPCAKIPNPGPGVSGEDSDQATKTPGVIEKTMLPKDTLDGFPEIPEEVQVRLAKVRGWSRDVIVKYGLRYNPRTERVLIPVLDQDGDLVNVRQYLPGATENKIMSWKAGFGSSKLFPIGILSESDKSEPIFLVEGEPDALCGLSHGMACITATTGADSWKDTFNLQFKGRHVIIVYDNDEAGRRGVEKVCKYLPKFAAKVESIEWPDWMKEKEDLTDWFVKYKKTPDELLELPRTLHVVKKEEDSPDVDPDILALNEKHAVIMVSGRCVILNEVDDPNFPGRRDITFSSPSDLKLYYASKKKWYTDERGVVKPVNVAKLWLESEHRRQYEGIMFDPTGSQNGYYNLYKGYATVPRLGNWSLFSKHVYEVIANRNQDVYNYVMCWIAHMFQRPGREPPGTAIVLQGGQGAGKGKAFADQLGRIWGHHYLHITNQHQITGRFNSHLKDCMLCFVDEAVWAGDKAAEGVLKGIITEDIVTVEPKGRDAYSVPSYIRLIIASNNNWVVPAGLDERRFCVLRVSDKHQQDSDYFSELFQQMDNGGREAFLYDMLNLDISRVDLRDFPRTEALFEQKLMSMNSVQQWWYWALNHGQLTQDSNDAWNVAIPTQKLHKAYLEFCHDHNVRYPVMDELFIKALNKLTHVYKTRPRIHGKPVYHVKFEELDICREEFAAFIKFEIPWDQDDYA